MIKNVFLLILLLLCLVGCEVASPYHSTNKAAIVIHNQLDKSFTFYLGSIHSQDSLDIAPGEVEFLYEYEQEGKESSAPLWLEAFILVNRDCVISLSRQEIEEHFVLDPNGRPGWNLYLTDALYKTLGCQPLK